MKHRTGSNGFTLIELLAGMAVLMIIVLFLNRIFADSTTMWKLGNKRIESNTDGRAVVAYMLRELSGAIVDNTVTLKLKSGQDNVLGAGSDRIYFATSDQVAERRGANTYRQLRQVGYRVASMRDAQNNVIANRYRILRSGVEQNESASYTCYVNKQWWNNTVMDQGGDILAENVRALEFWVYDSNQVFRADYDSTQHGPPAWIDVSVELLGEADSIRVAQLSGTNQLAYADQVARRYVGRAYFQNRMGYVAAQ